MRKLKKFIKNMTTLYINRLTIRDTRQLLKQEFGDITFEFSSFGGADINYLLLKDKKKFAMLRLAITDKKEEKNDLALLRFNKQKRLAKETQAYKEGGKYNLTPNLLYAFDDGVVCEYLEGERGFDTLMEDKSKVWDILIDVIQVYNHLHHLDITHLDATLKNFILDNGQMKVIDFEYYPSENLTLEVQKAYDYIRIIEHTLRIIPLKYQKNYDSFIDVLDGIITEELREVDFTMVERWLKNIENYPIYPTLKRRIFINL